jgi:hypothetical protein
VISFKTTQAPPGSDVNSYKERGYHIITSSKPLCLKPWRLFPFLILFVVRIPGSRVHSGVSIENPYTIEKPVNEKEFVNAEQKKKIAKAALSLMGETDSIIFGSHTTVFELARCLNPPKHLIVITPALKVALERFNVDSLRLVIDIPDPGRCHPLLRTGCRRKI